MSLANKKILLGIGGGVAAYKCAELTRQLSKAGAEVRVVMSKSATEFITPLTLQALSGNPVGLDLLDPAAEAAMGHIELAKWANAYVIAPATANLLARMSAGMADELITTAALATDAPVAVCPAMNQQMYRHAATQANLETLKSRGVHIFGPASGEQACGDVGPGRMIEPEQIVEQLQGLFVEPVLNGVSLLITAGPTQEALDPVRYLTNKSSGKMGYALAEQAVALGANVTLVSGPVSLAAPAGVKRISVESAADMHQAVMAEVEAHQVFIGCAAVADYRPVSAAEQKIKKSNAEMSLELVRNPDILADVAKHAKRPFTVGFAAETNDVETYARGKLERKNLDMIAANDVSKAGQGFNADTNALTVYWKDGERALAHGHKRQIARQLLQLIQSHLQSK
ncbi:bifunctional phosphopantothenoylcysteine decarboxylase/phosphopantothenate--cysteine ligase CoaBC [Paraferrimonas sedimenticola]|uniref:Coenzyme A biosynthesis bifunctional protein CoaBC n=1 Tax=Paraferrimonas sedimenticola TaxID=375674 RepID=A0AA37RST8_9GAMM|nr:bifunctional phosphopantothenoylcysteine decarboxylase/phosphopantothenate--cysteine ligase CoaBC [Paraferrimonas sedimenticola]GLP95333.1 coenzyme A biosynthesis bifunctional protein CoaBC [Paraferrimonas sedimenticola]